MGDNSNRGGRGAKGGYGPPSRGGGGQPPNRGGKGQGVGNPAPGAAQNAAPNAVAGGGPPPAAPQPAQGSTTSSAGPIYSQCPVVEQALIDGLKRTEVKCKVLKTTPATNTQLSEVEWCWGCGGGSETSCAACRRVVLFVEAQGVCVACKTGKVVPVWYHSPKPCTVHFDRSAARGRDGRWKGEAYKSEKCKIPRTKLEMARSIGLTEGSDFVVEDTVGNRHAVMAAARCKKEKEMVMVAMSALEAGHRVCLVGAGRVCLGNIPTVYTINLTMVDRFPDARNVARRPIPGCSPLPPHEAVAAWAETAAANDMLIFFDCCYYLGNDELLNGLVNRGVKVGATYLLSPGDGLGVFYPASQAFLLTDAKHLEGQAFCVDGVVRTSMAGNQTDYLHKAVQRNWQITGAHVGGMCSGWWAANVPEAVDAVRGSGAGNRLSNATAYNLAASGFTQPLVLPDLLRQSMAESVETSTRNLVGVLRAFWYGPSCVVSDLVPVGMQANRLDFVAKAIASRWHYRPSVVEEAVNDFFVSSTLWQQWLVSRGLSSVTWFNVLLVVLLSLVGGIFLPVFGIHFTRLSGGVYACLIVARLLWTAAILLFYGGLTQVDEADYEIRMRFDLGRLFVVLMVLWFTRAGVKRLTVRAYHWFVLVWWAVGLVFWAGGVLTDQHMVVAGEVRASVVVFEPVWMKDGLSSLSHMCSSVLGERQTCRMLLSKVSPCENVWCTVDSRMDYWYGSVYRVRYPFVQAPEFVEPGATFWNWVSGRFMEMLATPYEEATVYTLFLKMANPWFVVISKLLWSFEWYYGVLGGLFLAKWLGLAGLAQWLLTWVGSLDGVLSVIFAQNGLWFGVRKLVLHLVGVVIVVVLEYGVRSEMVLERVTFASEPNWWYGAQMLVFMCLSLILGVRPVEISYSRKLWESILVTRYDPPINAGKYSGIIGKTERHLTVLRDVVPSFMLSKKGGKLTVGGVSILRGESGYPTGVWYGSGAVARAILVRNISVVAPVDARVADFMVWFNQLLDNGMSRVVARGPSAVTDFLEMHARKFTGQKALNYSWMARLLQTGGLPGFELSARTGSMRAMDGYLTGFTKLEFSKLKGKSLGGWDWAGMMGETLSLFGNPTKPRVVCFPTSVSQLGNREVAMVVSTHALCKAVMAALGDEPWRFDFERPLNESADDLENRIALLQAHSSDSVSNFQYNLFKEYLAMGHNPERVVRPLVTSSFCSKVLILANDVHNRPVLTFVVPFDRLVARFSTLSGNYGTRMAGVLLAKLEDLLAINEGCEFSVLLLMPMIAYLRRLTQLPVVVKPTSDWTPVYANAGSRTPHQAGTQLTALMLGMNADDLREELERYGALIGTLVMNEAKDDGFETLTPFAHIRLPEDRFPLLNKLLNPFRASADWVKSDELQLVRAAQLYAHGCDAEIGVLRDALNHRLQDVVWVRREYTLEGSILTPRPTRGRFKNFYIAEKLRAFVARFTTIVLLGAGRTEMVEAMTEVAVGAGATVLVVEDHAYNNYIYGWGNNPVLFATGVVVNSVFPKTPTDPDGTGVDNTGANVQPQIVRGGVNWMSVRASALRPDVFRALVTLGQPNSEHFVYSDVAWPLASNQDVSAAALDALLRPVEAAHVGTQTTWFVKLTSGILRTCDVAPSTGNPCKATSMAMSDDWETPGPWLIRAIGHKSLLECFYKGARRPVLDPIRGDGACLWLLVTEIMAHDVVIQMPARLVGLPGSADVRLKNQADLWAQWSAYRGFFRYQEGVVRHFREIENIVANAGRADLNSFVASEYDAVCADGSHGEALRRMVSRFADVMPQILDHFDPRAFTDVLMRPLSTDNVAARLANMDSMALASGLPWTTLANTLRFAFIGRTAAHTAFGGAGNQQYLALNMGDDSLFVTRLGPNPIPGAPPVGGRV